MDMDTVLEVAGAIKRLKMYPYFDICHYILNCMAVREDAYPQQTTGTRSIFIAQCSYCSTLMDVCCVVLVSVRRSETEERSF